MLKIIPRPTFVISLDFELFWGVIRSRSIEDYQNNVYGVEDAIPAIIDVFNEYQVSATWAVVGSILCDNFNEWNELINEFYFDYSIFKDNEIKKIIKNNPRLFFNKKLVQLIKNSSSQELASHTFAHYEVENIESDKSNFRKDMLLNNMVMNENSIIPNSIVFPRNIIDKTLISTLPELGIKTFRGNQNNFLYKDGDRVPFGLFGKGLRYLDSSFNLSGSNSSFASEIDGVINIPSTYFLRPISGSNARNFLNYQRLRRIKNYMTQTAKSNGTFHMWWHPHNFGNDLKENIYFLNQILDHFIDLKSKYKMVSATMDDFFTS